jgi:hypothetical protein
LWYVTIRFKIADVSAVDPCTGDKVYRNMHSDQWCIPIMTLISKDSKASHHKCFGDILDLANHMRTEGLTLEDRTKWNIFLIPEPQDMKSHQLCLGCGGASKGPVILNVCQLYMYISDNIAVQHQVTCQYCLENTNEFCFHYDVIDRKLIRDAKEELLRLKADKLVMKVKRMCEATVSRDVWDKSTLSPLVPHVKHLFITFDACCYQSRAFLLCFNRSRTVRPIGPAYVINVTPSIGSWDRANRKQMWHRIKSAISFTTL